MMIDWTCDSCKKTFKVPKGSNPRCGCKQELRGLGDVVAKVTSAVGVKPCGKCKERQAKLNRLVPFKRSQ